MENESEVIVLAAIFLKPRSWQKADISTLDLAFLFKLEDNYVSMISVY